MRQNLLNHKQLETYSWVVSTMVTDAFMLQHQATSIHNADQISIVFDQLKISHFSEHQWKIKLEPKGPDVYWLKGFLFNSCFRAHNCSWHAYNNSSPYTTKKDYNNFYKVTFQRWLSHWKSMDALTLSMKLNCWIIHLFSCHKKASVADLSVIS